MSTLVSDSIEVAHVHHPHSVLFIGFKSLVDLIIVDILDIDIILGMTKLYKYHNVLNYNAKTVTLAL